MARAVPFPSLPRAANDPCGTLATFFWAGEYRAPCILRSGHGGIFHWDGITYSTDPGAFPADDEETGR